MPAIHALGDGYEVYIVTDASGGVGLEAHEMAVRRMVQAGAVPITWTVFGSELQRDWAREETVPALAETLFSHMGNVGTSLRWEQQFLGSKGGGDDAPSKAVVKELFGELGFATVDLGTLASGACLQQFPGGPLPTLNLVKLS